MDIEESNRIRPNHYEITFRRVSPEIYLERLMQMEAVRINNPPTNYYQSPLSLYYGRWIEITSDHIAVLNASQKTRFKCDISLNDKFDLFNCSES